MATPHESMMEGLERALVRLDLLPRGLSWHDDVARIERSTPLVLRALREVTGPDTDVLFALPSVPGFTFDVVPVVLPMGVSGDMLPFLDAVLRHARADAYLLLLSRGDDEDYAVYSGLSRERRATVFRSGVALPLDLRVLGDCAFFGLGDVEEREHDAAVGEA